MVRVGGKEEVLRVGGGCVVWGLGVLVDGYRRGISPTASTVSNLLSTPGDFEQ